MIDDKKLRHLMANGPAVVYTADPQTRSITSVSPNVVHLLGFTEEQWLCRPELWGEVVHPEDMLEIRFLHPRLFEKDAQSLEYRMLRKDGAWRWVHDEAVLHRDGQGEPLEVVGFIYDIDDRKGREESLRREAALFEAMFRHHAAVMYLADAQTGRILDANAAALRFYGLDHPTITAMHRSELGCGGPECHSKRAEAPARGENRVGFARHGLANGEERDVEVRITPILVGEREVLFAVITDVTARVQAEQALRASEEGYRGLFENAMEGIFQSTVQGRMVTCNPAMARLLNYASPRECQRDLGDLDRRMYADPRDRRRFLELLTRDGAVEGFEAVLRRSDGQRIWASLNGRAVRDAEGRFVSIDGMMLDITARKRAEAERMLLVAAVEQATEGVAIAGENWAMEYANPAFGDILGVSRAPLLGVLFFDLFSLPRLPVRDIKNVLGRGEEWTGPLRGERGDGSPYQAEAVLSPIRDENGHVSRYVILVRDVTRQERLERRLRRAQKLEAIGTLAGGIAHDFNNILTPILLNAEMALQSLGPQHSLAKSLEAILDAGGRARQLIRQILTFSRQGGLRTERVELSGLVQEATKLLRATLPADIEAHLKIQAESLPVLADSSQILQIFMNLAANAVHAMREGGGALTVSLDLVRVGAEGLPGGPLLPEGEYACLGVRDTGHGIEAAMQERIFTPFFTTKKPGEGTGMGLSTVHGIARSMGGGVRVESRLGEGSFFAVYLPLAPLSEERQAEPGPGEPGRVAPRPGETGRAMVVDADAFARRSVGMLLHRLGFRVTHMADTAKALRAIGRAGTPFAVLLAGENLRDIEGREFLAACRAWRPGAALVLMADQAVDAAGIGAADGVLVKPVTTAALAATLRKALAKSAARQRRLQA